MSNFNVALTQASNFNAILRKFMQKRYQVFVSSTYDDLKEERSKVITSLLNIDCIPCGMEYFPASDDQAWECIERLIPECDYYVLILAGRYGSIPKGGSKSYTHKEYELAIKCKVPVIALVHASPSKIALEKSESNERGKKQLIKFREQVSRKLRRTWTTPDELAAELLASLTAQIKAKPRVGWIRADQITSNEAKDEIIALRRSIEKYRKTITDLENREDKAEADLASGDDPLEIRGEGAARNEENTEIGYYQVTFLSTWNSMLRFLRRSYRCPWNQWTLQEALEKDMAKKFISCAGKHSDSPRVRLANGEIDKIHSQMNALGMICMRSGKWDFTTKGLQAASRLTALRKGEKYINLDDWYRLDSILIGVDDLTQYML